ncbi:MAG: bacterial regulatory helix-turn-helix s, AraC family protein [Micavibrio sp.]|nr:bacterial regulatory helix-turn-helix s, AraC family protein [Micavibrio sp.]
MLMGQNLNQLQFSIPEILSLIGLIQCVYVLVYMSFRAGGFRHAAVPFLYFFILGAAFFIDFAARIFNTATLSYTAAEWSLWFAGPPLSVLLMIQIARINVPPAARHFMLMAVLPVAFVCAVMLAKSTNHCAAIIDCPGFREWLILTGFLAGLISLFMMWSQRPLLAQLSAQPAGRDRYWLILALVIMNLFFLATALLMLTPVITEAQGMTIRTIWGLGFVYLAGTSLFRIYPQAIKLMQRNARAVIHDEDAEIIKKIGILLSRDKVYHEPAYNRVSLAKEVGVSESVISRVINRHFGKSLPQLLNELRVADAKRLLLETEASIKTVAEEVGFNSIASFNRAFKEIEGHSPGQFRDHKKKI